MGITEIKTETQGVKSQAVSKSATVKSMQTLIKNLNKSGLGTAKNLEDLTKMYKEVREKWINELGL